jgi:hypothetical protein
MLVNFDKLKEIGLCGGWLLAYENFIRFDKDGKDNIPLTIKNCRQFLGEKKQTHHRRRYAWKKIALFLAVKADVNFDDTTYQALCLHIRCYNHRLVGHRYTHIAKSMTITLKELPPERWAKCLQQILYRLLESRNRK